MQIRIRKIGQEEKEYIEIGCHKEDENVSEIVQFLKERQGNVRAYQGERQYEIPVVDIFYIEAVDNRTYLYLAEENYEAKQKLYEFEELLTKRGFVRISKSMLLNLMKVKAIKPALNGRFLCQLANGEEVIISRKYVPELKARLKRYERG